MDLKADFWWFLSKAESIMKTLEVIGKSYDFKLALLEDFGLGNCYFFEDKFFFFQDFFFIHLSKLNIFFEILRQNLFLLEKRVLNWP